jgi:uncharacterized Tic20 family protein
MSTADELKKLQELKDDGTLSEEEFQQAKESLLAADGSSSDVNMWNMCIHLTQFCGYLVAGLGWVVPIVMWQMKKDDPTVDKHGRIVTNWILTEIILGLIFFLLTFIIIGWPLLLVLAILSVIYPIIGGVKANNGELWKYPFSLQVFHIEEEEEEPPLQDETPTKIF